MDINTLGNLLLYGPLAGVGAYHFGKKGLDMDRMTFGPADLRLVRVNPNISASQLPHEKTSSEKNASFRKFRQQQEKIAGGIIDIRTLVPGVILGTTVGSGIEGMGRGVSSLTSPVADVIGYKAYKHFFPGAKGMMAFTRAPEKALQSAAESMGKELGTSAATGMSKLVSGLMGHNEQIINASPRRKAILQQLRVEDPIIAKLPEQQLLETFHSMVSVAPTLSTDKNAVRSFLRTVAVAPEGGVDWNTMKGLADAEASILKARGEI